MWKLVIGVGVVALVLGAAFTLMNTGGSRASQVDPTTTLPSPDNNRIVVAEAKLVPAQKSALTVAQGGIVAEVLVKEGDRVQAGQTLVRLASAEQEAAVARAEAELTVATASYDKLRAGSSEAEIAAAEAIVQQRQGQ